MQAELTLVDTEKKWIVDPCSFKSKSSNSAFKNMELKGKAVGVISDGIMQYFENNKKEYGVMSFDRLIKRIVDMKIPR